MIVLVFIFIFIPILVFVFVSTILLIICSKKAAHTSSRLDCFCLLALTPDATSLGGGGAWWVSITGLGIPELLAGLLPKGACPRPPLRLGVPLIVPDISSRIFLEGG